jgi:hypothetical protein
VTADIGPEQLAVIVDELEVLWPALPIALPRDGGTSSGERVTTSENIHTVPLNVQVAAVITDLTRGIPDWTRWASTAANLGPTAASDIPACLRRLPGIHHTLLQQGRTRDAAKLADTAQSWLTAARRALGLDAPDQAFGETCPRHDTPLQPLITPGDIGHLRWTKLDRAGYPVDPTITWTHIDVVLCRHCDSIWTPDRYRFLYRLIKQAKTERGAREETGDAA